MNNYCNLLNLTIPPLSGFDIYSTPSHQVPVDLKYLNPDMKNLLASIGIFVVYIDLFYRKPRHQGTIHVDNNGGDFTKINWVYGGRGSTMHFFELKDPESHRDKPILLTEANTEYKRYMFSEVEHKYQSTMPKPCLVQVGKPHLIINPLEDRYALCFVTVDKNGNRIPMKEAQQMLKEYIIDLP